MGIFDKVENNIGTTKAIQFTAKNAACWANWGWTISMMGKSRPYPLNVLFSRAAGMIKVRTFGLLLILCRMT